MPTSGSKTDRPRPEVGQELELELNRLGHGGEAIGRADDFVHFVRYGAPGDRVRVAVREVRRSFARSRILDILDPAPTRVEPRCPYFGKCGGCHLQHLNDDAQLTSRQQVLRDSLERISAFRDPKVEAAVSGDSRWAYRHRMTLHARTPEGGRPTIGFVDASGRRLVSIEKCAIGFAGFEPVLRALGEVASEADELEGRIELRTGYPAGEVHVYLGPGTEVLVSPLLRRLQSTSDVDRVNLFWKEGSVPKCAPRANPPALRLEAPWATWHVPPTAFYQVNPPLAIRLATQVADWADLKAGDLALDLYGGMGFFASAFARDARRVWVLEGHFSAVRAGEAAMRRAGIDNVRFVPGPVEFRLPTMGVKGQLTVAVLDPPRDGITKPIIKALVRFAPRRIIYISCEPSTLARDLKWLAASGYRHVTTIPYDFFPQTYHVESVTLLERS